MGYWRQSSWRRWTEWDIDGNRVEDVEPNRGLPAEDFPMLKSVSVCLRVYGRD